MRGLYHSGAGAACDPEVGLLSSAQPRPPSCVSRVLPHSSPFQPLSKVFVILRPEGTV